MPGALPKLNRLAVEYAIKAGLTLDCTIARRCGFDRKNYVYPDLPKAYQVSQLYTPICCDGHLDVDVNGKEKTIRIREIHMEEDSGKLIHDPQSGCTLMDFNRCGVPLIEIVTQPDFRSAAEVIAWLEKLRETLLYLDICDGKMQEGSLRVDINLSARPAGGEMGVRTEMKNLNSFKAIGRAIGHETARQIDILEAGGHVVQETRRWDDGKGVSVCLRSKENVQDYRYFPEPDLPPIEIDDAWLARVKENLPELAYQKRVRYICDFGLSAHEASVLTGHTSISSLFEVVAAESGEPLEAAHLITGEIMRLMNDAVMPPEKLSVDSKKFSALIRLLKDGRISRGAYKEAVAAVFANDMEPEAYIAEKGLMMIADSNTVAEAVEKVLTQNPDAVRDYRGGKKKAFGFLMGQVMRALGNSADPDFIRSALADQINQM